MKSSINLFKIAAFFVYMTTATVFANVQEGAKIQETSEKIYVGLENIHFNDNKIFVCINRNWIRTGALYSDASGIYVSAAWPWTPFVCRNCGTPNGPTNFVCERCGEPRSK